MMQGKIALEEHFFLASYDARGGLLTFGWCYQGTRLRRVIFHRCPEAVERRNAAA
jgi:hypothetical protein